MFDTSWVLVTFVDPTDRAWRRWDLALGRPDGQSEASQVRRTAFREASLGPFLNSLASSLLWLPPFPESTWEDPDLDRLAA